MKDEGRTDDNCRKLGGKYSNCVLGVLGKIPTAHLDGLCFDDKYSPSAVPFISFVDVRRYSPLRHEFVERHRQSLGPNSKRRNAHSGKYFQGASVVLLPGEVEWGGEGAVSSDLVENSFSFGGGGSFSRPVTVAYLDYVPEKSANPPLRESAVLPLNDVSLVQVFRYFLSEAHPVLRHAPPFGRLGMISLNTRGLNGLYQRRLSDISKKLGRKLVGENLEFH
ncbi:hypothetical protein CMI41_04460 [Candidatus Pacearchaeota archaeon]|nr:hypothetical protein [Candidatus Pacearchaeota archaeon]|tara:strand:+ start:163 stop:828 length:666 start_codon:yes stop_codon:yes gene_type:complete